MSIKEYLIYKSFLSLTTSHDFGSWIPGPGSLMLGSRVLGPGVQCSGSQVPDPRSRVFILDYAKVN